MKDTRKPVKPFLSIGGVDCSDNLRIVKFERHDNYWYPEIYPDAEVEESQLPQLNRFAQTCKNCYVEFNGENVSSYFGSIHVKESNDPRRAWAGYELIMTTPDPFPDDWQRYFSNLPQDVPIRVLVCPDAEPACKQNFECDMYVHYIAHWWSIGRPFNQGRIIMRSRAAPRSLPLVC